MAKTTKSEVAHNRSFVWSKCFMPKPLETSKNQMARSTPDQYGSRLSPLIYVSLCASLKETHISIVNWD